MNGLPAADPHKAAFVLSGGGAKGAYEIGVMRAVMDGSASSSTPASRDPAVFSGTSVGAFNAAVMACLGNRTPLQAVEHLREIWLDRIASTLGACGNGVFRLRGLPIQELDPGCFLHPVRGVTEFAADSAYLASQALVRGMRFMVSTQPLPGRVFESIDVSVFVDDEPLRRLIADEIDYDGLVGSGRALRVTASNWENGEARIFDNLEVAINPDVLRASLAIPGVFPEVDIDGVPFVDGGLSMNTPLSPAIAAGADEIHVIYLDPLLEDSDYPETANTFDVLARTFTILTSHRVLHDLQRAWAINQGLRMLRGSGGRGRERVDGGELLEALGVVTEDLGEAETWRQLTVHRYRPGGNLGDGADLLNFSHRQIEKLIELGYHDGVHHDCRAAGCLLATEATERPADPVSAHRVRHHAGERPRRRSRMPRRG